MDCKIGDKFIIEIDEFFENYDANATGAGPRWLYKAKGFNSLVFDEIGLSKMEKFDDGLFTKRYAEEYSRGFVDAIGMIKGMFHIAPDKDFFDGNYVEDIINLHTANEIVAAVNAYNERAKKAAEKPLKIGDEIVANGKHGIVFSIKDDGSYAAFASDGDKCIGSSKLARRTGRSFPELARIIDLLNSLNNGRT